MSIHRHAARVDANQAAIVDALRRIGCVVYEIRQPCDLLIGHRRRWLLAEVKDGAKAPSARRLTAQQEALVCITAARDLPFLLLTDPEQAIAAVATA
jgi:hypothetical protein